MDERGTSGTNSPIDEGCSAPLHCLRFRHHPQPLRARPRRKGLQRSAPVIKLPEGASVEDHLRLLGALNSSVACFWLKQNSHNKGNGGTVAASATKTGNNVYEFTGTTLKDFPLPAPHPSNVAKLLDDLAHELQLQSPAERREPRDSDRGRA